jgi:16S rRNA (adenine1518-N6/adenine1519-N6)-dimethyltransferase
MAFPRTLLTAWDIRAKKKFGQNFLADPSTAEMIVARSGITPEDTVLEIGPGLGALTVPLARGARRVIAVERDGDLLPLLRNELMAKGIDNVETINSDILDVDMGGLADGKIVVVGNLPYNISSQILIRLVAARDSVSRAVFMFQKELAERIVAPPGCKEYGRLSVVLQYCADIRTVAEVGSGLFYPRPKVDSEVIEIRFKEKPDAPADDESFLFDVIKAAFGKRRKTLRNSLGGSELTIDVAGITAALEDAGIDPVRRAETLTVSEFVALSNALGRIAGGGGSL